MNAESSLPHHHLPPDRVVELLHGEGGPAVVDLLLRAEHSRRLLLLRILDDTTDLGPAWELLSEAQRLAPSVVDTLFTYPQTGMWLATALRRLRGAGHLDEPPLWVVLSHISALAAAAALRAELDFAIEVPVWQGFAPLPTLGSAQLPVSERWSMATVRAESGHAVVEASGTTVALPLPRDSPAPGWHPVRRLAVGPSERQLEVTLEDVDPFRTYPQPTGPHPLSEEAVGQWREVLKQAWEVLSREQPDSAEAMRRGVFSLTPTPATERFRPRSVTAGDAFGGIEASEPDDAVQLAVTLVHEFQHTKLGGLLHLTPLVSDSTDQSTELWYAPWRDDPRPLAGLLQGIYAFVGITGFWRTHRTADTGQTAMAHFEFALWREHVMTAMDQVHRHPHLTPLGAALLDTLRNRCAGWLKEPVPEEQRALAGLCAADHAARWRAHHLRPSPSAVAETVRAWLSGASGPPPHWPQRQRSYPIPPRGGWTAWRCSSGTASIRRGMARPLPRIPRRPTRKSPEHSPRTPSWPRVTPPRPAMHTWPSSPRAVLRRAPGRGWARPSGFRATHPEQPASWTGTPNGHERSTPPWLGPCTPRRTRSASRPGSAHRRRPTGRRGPGPRHSRPHNGIGSMSQLARSRARACNVAGCAEGSA